MAGAPQRTHPTDAFLLVPGNLEKRESGKLGADPDGARNFWFKKKFVLKHYIYNLVKHESGILFHNSFKKNLKLHLTLFTFWSRKLRDLFFVKYKE